MTIENILRKTKRWPPEAMWKDWDWHDGKTYTPDNPIRVNSSVHYCGIFNCTFLGGESK